MKNKDILIILSLIIFIGMFFIIKEPENDAQKIAKQQTLSAEQREKYLNEIKEQRKKINETPNNTQINNTINTNNVNNTDNTNNINNIDLSIKDRFYKEKIITNSKNPNFNINKMNSILGPSEIKEFIRKNNNNPYIYSARTKNFRANLHIHTLASDGAMSPLMLLSNAAALARSTGDTIYIAITDHNTTEGAKKVVEILQANPEKYKNVKVLLGIEVFSEYQSTSIIHPVGIHVLCWGIDPYDPELNYTFYKKNKNDKWNYSYRTFENAIRLLSTKGIVGIAHPARYVEKQNIKTSYEDYYENLFNTYLYINSQDTSFIEGYYQSYSGRPEFRNLSQEEFTRILKLINKTATNKNIIKTGSYDSHGTSILSR